MSKILAYAKAIGAFIVGGGVPFITAAFTSSGVTSATVYTAVATAIVGGVAVYKIPWLPNTTGSVSLVESLEQDATKVLKDLRSARKASPAPLKPDVVKGLVKGQGTAPAVPPPPLPPKV